MIDLARTANPLAWAYTLCALVTVIITFVLLAQTQDDSDIQRAETNRANTWSNRVALRLARGAVENIGYMIGIQILVLVMGGAAMLTAPPNPNQPVTSLGWVFAVGLVGIDLLSFIKAVRAYIRRRAALRDIREHRAEWDGIERRQSER